MKKICAHCNNLFYDNTRPKNKKTCSRKCADEARKARQRKEYRQENPPPLFIGRKASMRNAARRRLARLRYLPDDLSHDQEDSIFDIFRGSCALSGDFNNIHLDHVIPISIGHGGTIYENMIPLRGDLNISKSNHNIFDWFAENRDRFGLEQRKFDELITYLANINNMPVDEYERYVRWCHDNPRVLSKEASDNTLNI